MIRVADEGEYVLAMRAPHTETVSDVIVAHAATGQYWDHLTRTNDVREQQRVVKELCDSGIGDMRSRLALELNSERATNLRVNRYQLRWLGEALVYFVANEPDQPVAPKDQVALQIAEVMRLKIEENIV